jgi:hypothetical protein
MDNETKMTEHQRYLSTFSVDGWLEPDPLFSEILPGLFMGGTAGGDTIYEPQIPDFRRADLPFDSIVTMYYASRPADWNVQELRYAIKDSHLGDVNLDRLLRAVQWGWEQWAIRGDRVLVRCQGGLNRSGLVMALILIKNGMDAGQAIETIRLKRGERALYNNDYVMWLLDNGDAFARDAVLPIDQEL